MKPTLTIKQAPDNMRWRWVGWLWWDEGDSIGHGMGAYAYTRLGARFAAWRLLRSHNRGRA